LANPVCTLFTEPARSSRVRESWVRKILSSRDNKRMNSRRVTASIAPSSVVLCSGSVRRDQKALKVLPAGESAMTSRPANNLIST